MAVPDGGTQTDKINVTRTRVSRYKTASPSFRFPSSSPFSPTLNTSIDSNYKLQLLLLIKSFDHTLLRGVIA
jgi:hypothetical protein